MSRWVLGILAVTVLAVAGSVAPDPVCAGTRQPEGADCDGHKPATLYTNHDTEFSVLVTFEVQNTGDCTVRVADPGTFDLGPFAETPGGETQTHSLRVHHKVQGIPVGHLLEAACVDKTHRKCEYDITVTGVAILPKKEKEK